MPRAKITSKGQVTIPAEVRRELGLSEGDFIAFELKADYAIVRRHPSLEEALDAATERHPLGPSRYDSNRDAVVDLVREAHVDEGDDVYIVGQGTEETVSPKPARKRNSR